MLRSKHGKQIARYVVLGAFIGAVCNLAPSSIQAQSNSASGPVSTIKAGTSLVVVDVTVKDKQGKPVHGLPASFFHISEDGQAQAIQHFEEHKTELGPAPGPAPKAEAGVFSNRLHVRPDQPLTVLLIDSLNTPRKDQVYLRQQLESYLKKTSVNQQIAVMTLTSGLNMLQGFTSDPALLRDAVTNKKNIRNPLFREDGPVYDFMSEFQADQPTLNGVSMAFQNLTSDEGKNTELRIRVTYTMDAFNELARFLAGFPGRKNVIWFSASFPATVSPDSDSPDPFVVSQDFSDDIHETSFLLSSSEVAIYPVDVRGAVTPPTMGADNSGYAYVKNSHQLGKDLTGFFQQKDEEHLTMRALAEETGGIAALNNNDLAGAVANVLRDGGEYYRIDYVPSHAGDGDYHHIRVSLDGEYQISYRRGYQGGRIAPPAERRNVPSDALSPMKLAMRYGAPPLSQILFKSSVSPEGEGAGGSPQGALAPGTTASGRLKPPYRNYAIAYAIDVTKAAMPVGADGKHHFHFEYLILSYSDQGKLTTARGNEVDGALSESEYAALLRTGLHLTQEISVPMQGSFNLRLGVRDMVSGRIGALEVPHERLAGLVGVAPQTH